MKINGEQLNWIKGVGGKIYLTFKARRAPLLLVIGLAIVSPILLFNQVQYIRLAYAIAFSVVAMASSPYITNAVAMPALQMAVLSYHSRKYKSIEYSTDEIKQMIDKMGLQGKARVYKTENPWVKGPFCNIFFGKIYLPMLWLHPEYEPNAAASHELGHIKMRRIYAFEYIIGSLIVLEFSFFISLITIPAIAIMSSIALQMLLYTEISHRNEFRADYEGAIHGGLEGLISLFERFIWEAKGRDEGSETHPSSSARKERLIKLLDEEKSCYNERDL